MASLDDLQRTFFDGIYTNRSRGAWAVTALAGVALVIAGGAGWFRAARRHPFRAASLLIVVLIVGLPVGYYLASPIWIRTVLVEPGPIAAAPAVAPVTPIPTPIATPMSVSVGPSAPRPPAASGRPSPVAPPFAARRIASGSFHGTDDFHFGRGTATIVETAPGSYVIRLEDFSVRNGPDLYVYLSPAVDDHAPGALELGRLKATDGAFGYALPAGADPADFASAIIWCKQFSHLFAVAPLAAT